MLTGLTGYAKMPIKTKAKSTKQLLDRHFCTAVKIGNLNRYENSSREKFVCRSGRARLE